MDVDEPSDLMNATEKVVDREPESNERRDVNESGFRSCHMGPVGTGSPRTADEANNLDNMATGILGRDQELVKYSNPYLLGHSFPTLYPEGRGFFSKGHGIVEVDKIQSVQFNNGKLGTLRESLDKWL
ncbi:hypothetical protein BGZ47_002225 [Haplosporangium gracile]|nr:hypothetical protein BGZ47_002225 [Haplosporangium gracile]